MPDMNSTLDKNLVPKSTRKLNKKNSKQPTCGKTKSDETFHSQNFNNSSVQFELNQKSRFDGMHTNLFGDSGHREDMGLKERYWKYLFGNLQRCMSEIYQTCETNRDTNECKVILNFLSIDNACPLIFLFCKILFLNRKLFICS